MPRVGAAEKPPEQESALAGLFLLHLLLRLASPTMKERASGTKTIQPPQSELWSITNFTESGLPEGGPEIKVVRAIQDCRKRFGRPHQVTESRSSNGHLPFSPVRPIE